MRGQPLQDEGSARIAPLYGDGELLLTIRDSRLLQSFFNKDNTLKLLVTELLRLKLAMFSFAVGAIFRHRYGGRTVGLFLSVLTILMCMGLNSDFLYLPVKPFFPFIAPFFPVFVDTQFWQEFIFEDIQSTALFYYTWIFLLASLFHTGCIYFGFGNADDPTKRGDSIIYHAFFRYTLVSEYMVQAVFEPVITALVACIFWFLVEDKLFALFLAISALSQMLQEVLDKAYQTRLRIPE